MSYISAILKNNEVLVWERDSDGNRVEKYFKPPYYFYIDDVDGKYTTIYNTKVSKQQFKNSYEYNIARKNYKEQGIQTWESDISPITRILSNHYYNKDAPSLNITFWDIEVDYDANIGYSTVENPYAPINSVTLYHYNKKKMVVLCVPPDNNSDGWTDKSLQDACNIKLEIPKQYNIEFFVCNNEKELITLLLDQIQDSDVLCGWNSELFDMPYTTKRVEKAFGERGLKKLCFPNGELPKFYEVEVYNNIRSKVELSGRISADYMDLYKKYEPGERPSYSLEAISDIVLIDEETKQPVLPKLEYEGSLYELYRKDFAFFVRYNIRDCEILGGFEDRLGYVGVANLNYHISCGQFSDVFGTIRLAELALTNFCHHSLKRVVNDVQTPKEDRQISGALVLYPRVGLQEMVGSIDVGSLYPNVLRCLNGSPEKIVGQFLETEEAFAAISSRKDSQLTMEHNTTGELLTMNTSQWIEWLTNNKCAVSGYGTVFDQNSQGFIPAILSDWITQRKKYQALKKEAEKNKDYNMVGYYDRLQYVFKIKLNSLYGALTNMYFRFYDLRLGESTTCSGRAVVKHQCRKANELLGGSYNVDFPTYLTTEAALKAGHGPETALHGPKFNGKYQAEHIAYGDSVTGDTLIDLADGSQIAISQLFEKVDVEIGDKQYFNTSDKNVLTYDHINNKTTYKPIKYIMRHKCDKQMYRVWITNSQWVDVTEDHSVMAYINTRDRKKNESCIAEATPQDLINKPRRLVYAQTKPRSNIVNNNFPKQLYQLMGLVLGDGYVDKTSTGGTLLSVGSAHIDEIISKVLTPLKSEGWISSWVIKPNKHDIQISSTKLRSFLQEHLYANNTKNVPSIMFKETCENIQHFLSGWFTADGYCNINKTVGLCSIHEKLIQQAQQLLFFCGISSTYFTERTENSFKEKYSGTYTKKLIVKNIDVFASKVGFLLDYKQTRAAAYKPHHLKNYLKRYDFELAGIYKIQQLPKTTQYVYDIEVDDTHTFFANNILVHNTDSTYFKTNCNGVESAIKVADDVAEKVNASFPEFMSSAFLCQPDYNSFIKTGREIVSDKGIFVEKKRYILHLVDVEGKRCDKMKVMGLDTKKTTLPKHVADHINSLVGEFLKGQTWDEVAKKFVEYKDWLRKDASILDIGLPKGVKNVTEYTLKYKADKTTNLPGHVAASIFYNICLETYNDKENPPIMSGMKIKVYYLKRPNGRFKSIALPTDMKSVPEWFTANFEIDMDAHLERLVDNPLENIVKAIGKQAPSKHTLLVDSVLEF